MTYLAEPTGSRFATSKFEYRPISSPDAVRMLQLLAGEADDPIHIKLSHHPITDLPKCEVLSYVWGPEDREQDIICEAKILKGTPNLLEVLRRLRHRMLKSKHYDQTGLLWIDAICINQDDFAERSQQVQLMTDVYKNAERVLVWIGEEPALSRRTFDTLHLLDQTCRALNVEENSNVGGMNNVPDTTVLRNGVRLEQLPEDPVWSSVVDVLASRTYFTRLWTVQEVALSDESKTQVLCGSNLCPWLVFYHAVLLVQNCRVLRQTIAAAKLAYLNSVVDLKSMQSVLRDKALSMLNCVGRTEEQQSQVRWTQDRVFALLGMFLDDTRKSLSVLNYKTPLKEIFQTATAVMVLESQLLYHFIWRDVVYDRSEIPTWTGFSDFSPQYRFPSRLGKIKFLPEYPITFVCTEKVVTKQHIFTGLPVSFNSCSVSQANGVNYPILSTGGYIFDEIKVSFQNFAEDNFRPQILDAYRELCSDPNSSFNGANNILEAIWLPLSLYDKRLEPQEQYAQRTLNFIICFSRWVMEEFGVTSEIIAEHKALKEVGKRHPLITANLREDFKGASSTYKQEELEFFLDHSGLGIGALARNIMEAFLLYREKGQMTKHYGRNLFFSSRRYIGIGPMGDNRPGAKAPAVQVGDKIVLLTGLEIPVILRPDRDGLYRFIGPAHIPRLIEDPCFEAGNALEAERIRIL
jgi:Heterokaryon incompatibility protein (HET)